MRAGKRRLSAGLLVLASLVAACTSAGPDPAHLRLAVTPARALLDSSIGVTVTGAHPGDLVTISTSARDGAGTVWRSSARFRADTHGRASTAQAPVSGPYQGRNPLGLFQDQTPGGQTYPDGSKSFIADHWSITVTASDGSSTAPARTITRLYPYQVGVTAHELRPSTDDGLYGVFERPAHPTGRHTALLVFGGSEGGYQGFKAALLAAHGYPTLSLAYFHEPGLPAQLNRVPIEYFAKALRWLARQPEVDPHRIAVFGVSRGSEAAQLVAVHYPSLVAGVVLGSPSNIVFGALPGDGHSAWTVGGKEVPFDLGDDLFSATAVDHPEDVIPDQRIRGPVLADCGTDDDLWGSCAHMGAIGTALAHARHRPTLLTYPDAGHRVGSMLPAVPEYGADGMDAAGARYSLGGTQAADAVGRDDAWRQLLAWLARLPAV